MSTLDRRSFIATIPGVAAMTSLAFSQDGAKPQAASGVRASACPAVISSANGLVAVNRAMELLRGGSDPLEAVVAGINIVEDDPDDMSVGYGGLPNENGVVQLDSSCMHGPTCRAGAVAALENIRHPSSVALQVLRKTDHVLLVGAGALAFAKAMGFREENLLTEQARQYWMKWKRNLNPEDDWLNDDQRVPGTPGSVGEPIETIEDKQSRAELIGVPFSTGTIHCAAVDSKGDMGACTSTSGLSWKLPGRVGDSPIIGAGNFVDNTIGAAGATGRGEAVMQSCGAFQVVQHMANGDDPTQACLKVLKWIADHTKQNFLRNDKGEPNFNVTMYALRKDGVWGCAKMRREKENDKKTANKFAIHDGTEGRLMDCVILFE